MTETIKAKVPVSISSSEHDARLKEEDPMTDIDMNEIVNIIDIANVTRDYG